MIRNRSENKKPGVAILAFVTALLVIGSLALWLFQLSSSTASSSLSFYYGTSAIYAAESGLEMALAEFNATPANDSDSDGQIGTISDNDDDTDDPVLGVARFWVIQSSTTPPVYQAHGRCTESVAPWSEITRVIEARVE